MSNCHNINGFSHIKSPSSESFLLESIDLVDIVLKGDEFLEGDLDKKFNSTKVQKSEYLDSESFNKIY